MTPLQRFGLSAELWITELFRGVGFEVTLPPYFCQPGYDMLLDGFLPVHVKAARMKTRFVSKGVYGSRYQFNATNLFRYYDSRPALVLLVAQSQTVGYVPFFIPLDAFRGRSLVVSITSDPVTYSGWLSAYRWAWATLNSTLASSAAQHMVKLPFFSEVY